MNSIKSTLLTLLTLLVSLSAYAGNQDKILGDWRIDMEKFKASEGIAAMEEDPHLAPHVAMVIATLEKAKVVITEDELVTQIPLPDGTKEEEKEKYRIVSEEGNVLEIITTSSAGQESKGRITVSDDERLIVKIEDPKASFKTVHLIK